MNKERLILISAGVILLIWAYLSAISIPAQAHQDFNHMLTRNHPQGGISHSPTYRDTYLTAATHSRITANLWVGATGLLLLTLGLKSAFTPRRID